MPRGDDMVSSIIAGDNFISKEAVCVTAKGGKGNKLLRSLLASSREVKSNDFLQSREGDTVLRSCDELCNLIC